MRLFRRAVGQSIRIQPAQGLDPATPIGELFAEGPLQVVLLHAGCGDVRLAVFAGNRFIAVEDEAHASDHSEVH